jgi:hypothetical protein
MEPWRDFRPVVADSHHFDEEQDLDPGTYGIRIPVKSWIRISIEVMWIRKRNSKCYKNQDRSALDKNGTDGQQIVLYCMSHKCCA